MKQIKCERKVTYRTHDSSGRPVPFIPIQGVFLKQFKFDVGDVLRVNYSDNFVSISKVTNDDRRDNAAMVAVR